MIWCAYCGNSFKRDEHLERHILTHTNVKPWRCRDCHMSFSRRDLLQRHFGVHGRDADGKKGPNAEYGEIPKGAGRTPIACNHCARTKTKCDKAFPCSRCKEKGLQCQSRPNRRTSRQHARQSQKEGRRAASLPEEEDDDETPKITPGSSAPGSPSSSTPELTLSTTITPEPKLPLNTQLRLKTECLPLSLSPPMMSASYSDSQHPSPHGHAHTHSSRSSIHSLQCLDLQTPPAMMNKTMLDLHQSDFSSAFPTPLPTPGAVYPNGIFHDPTVSRRSTSLELDTMTPFAPTWHHPSIMPGQPQFSPISPAEQMMIMSQGLNIHMPVVSGAHPAVFGPSMMAHCHSPFDNNGDGGPYFQQSPGGSYYHSLMSQSPDQANCDRSSLGKGQTETVAWNMTVEQMSRSPVEQYTNSDGGSQIFM